MTESGMWKPQTESMESVLEATKKVHRERHVETTKKVDVERHVETTKTRTACRNHKDDQLRAVGGTGEKSQQRRQLSHTPREGVCAKTPLSRYNGKHYIQNRLVYRTNTIENSRMRERRC